MCPKYLFAVHHNDNIRAGLDYIRCEIPLDSKRRECLYLYIFTLLVKRGKRGQRGNEMPDLLIVYTNWAPLLVWKKHMPINWVPLCLWFSLWRGFLRVLVIQRWSKRHIDGAVRSKVEPNIKSVCTKFETIQFSDRSEYITTLSEGGLPRIIRHICCVPAAGPGRQPAFVTSEKPHPSDFNQRETVAPWWQHGWSRLS